MIASVFLYTNCYSPNFLSSRAINRHWMRTVVASRHFSGQLLAASIDANKAHTTPRDHDVVPYFRP